MKATIAAGVIAALVAGYLGLQLKNTRAELVQAKEEISRLNEPLTIEGKEDILDQEITVPGGLYVAITFEVREDAEAAKASGEFRADGGTGFGLTAVLGERPDVENYLNGNEAKNLYTSGRVTNGKINHPLRSGQKYMLLLDNRADRMYAKRVSGLIQLRYKQTIHRPNS